MKKIFAVIFASVLFSTMALTSIAAEGTGEDKEKPGDVENLKVKAMNASVEVSWDATTDNVGVAGYKVYYGTEKPTSSSYVPVDNKDAGKVTKYTVTELQNDKTYYFSVVAYDAAANESANWGTPITGATPKADLGGDTEAPKVASAEAVNKVEVKVVFTEEIVLPEVDPQDAFDIENTDDFTPLVVKTAEMDTEDEEGKTVILTTDNQVDKVEYELTAGLDIKDKAGNQIVSGTSDTAIFKGSAVEKTAEDTAGPKLLSAEAVDETHVLFTFDETIDLSIDPATNFAINEVDDQTKALEVKQVKLGPNSKNVEDATALVTTSEQESKKYYAIATGLKDLAGNEIAADKGTVEFQGKAKTGGTGDGDGDTPIPDILAPKDVANFLASAVVDGQKYLVTLKWSIPAENKGDTVQQLLYLSLDQGSKYDLKSELNPDKTEFEYPEALAPGEYWFKLTQKDAAGNESDGVVTKITLAETGPGVVALVLASLGLGRIVGRKKKKV